MTTRLTYRRTSPGWAEVTVYGASGARVHRSKVRDSKSSLQALSTTVKARGASHVTWAAVSPDLSVGTVHY